MPRLLCNSSRAWLTACSTHVSGISVSSVWSMNSPSTRTRKRGEAGPHVRSLALDAGLRDDHQSPVRSGRHPSHRRRNDERLPRLPESGEDPVELALRRAGDGQCQYPVVHAGESPCSPTSQIGVSTALVSSMIHRRWSACNLSCRRRLVRGELDGEPIHAVPSCSGMTTSWSSKASY